MVRVSLASDTINMNILVGRDNLLPSVDALFSVSAVIISREFGSTQKHNIPYILENMCCIITLVQFSYVKLCKEL